MTRWQSWLFDDLGNKALALGLAAGVWWLMQSKFEVRKDYSFVVVVTRPGEASDPEQLHDTLRLEVPEGWKLVRPLPGSEVEFSFYGTRSKLSRFFRSHCSAGYALVRPPEDSVSFEDIVAASELRWMRSQEAAELLRQGNPSQNELRLLLRREEVSTVRFTLSSEDVQLVGPAAGLYRVRPFAPRRWVAELAQDPGLPIAFDAAWVAEHLVFYAPVHDAPDPPGPVRLEWDVYGVEPPQQQELLRRSLAVHPESGSDDEWIVELERIGHE